jgi:hypothetical protein
MDADLSLPHSSMTGTSDGGTGSVCTGIAITAATTLAPYCTAMAIMAGQ